MKHKKSAPKRVQIALDGTIETQEVFFVSSGSGTSKSPHKIGTYVELNGTLDMPFDQAKRFIATIYEHSGKEEGALGTISGVKPVVRIYLHADSATINRMITLVAHKRLARLYATSEKPHYGFAQLVHWSLRTAPETGEEVAPSSH